MKYILLASASAFAFAGAAAAEVTFSGEAELGYNDSDGTWADDDNAGFYWSANIGVALTQELNNGLTAGASVNFDIADLNSGMGLESADYLLWLESENAGLYFGTTDTAAGKHWSGTDGMEADNFTTDASDAVSRHHRADGSYGAGGGHLHDAGATPPSRDDAPLVLRGDISYGGIDASVSYLVNPTHPDADLEQLSVGASGSFGNFNFALAYQDNIGSNASGTLPNGPWRDGGDFSTDRVYAISVGTTFSGADITLAYANNDTQGFDSIGIQGSYPIGPVTVGAYYVVQDVAFGDGNTWGITADYASGPIGVSVYYEDYESATPADWGIDASYDVGNGLTVYAGVAGAGDAPYVAGEFDMGNGATLGLSYADDNAAHDQEDEIGAREYQEGATAWVSFTF